MRILYHPEFPGDIRREAARYAEISPGLKTRFRTEIDEAIETTKQIPGAAGHFLNTGSLIIPEIRRRNLKAFPFFILYGLQNETLIFSVLIASRSDPLH
ncbi:hypothetical protein OpiT1DRAFT_03125 [Opitutaceae bacterium TAV1]|nr:hypothetical protein OpiT1DRAFT_03125 [Opitutaceae bacterium TAV1]